VSSGSSSEDIATDIIVVPQGKGVRDWKPNERCSRGQLSNPLKLGSSYAPAGDGHTRNSVEQAGVASETGESSPVPNGDGVALRPGLSTFLGGARPE
jgi:hypothetical protein